MAEGGSYRAAVLSRSRVCLDRRGVGGAREQLARGARRPLQVHGFSGLGTPRSHHGQEPAFHVSHRLSERGQPYVGHAGATSRRVHLARYRAIRPCGSLQRLDRCSDDTEWMVQLLVASAAYDKSMAGSRCGPYARSGPLSLSACPRPPQSDFLFPDSSLIHRC